MLSITRMKSAMFNDEVFCPGKSKFVNGLRVGAIVKLTSWSYHTDPDGPEIKFPSFSS